MLTRVPVLAALTFVTLAGCIERKETIKVGADGAVDVLVEHHTESHEEMYLGDAVPTLEGGWLVERWTEIDEDGDWSELSPDERRDLLNGMIMFERQKHAAIARLAFEDAAPRAPQDAWLAVSAAIMDMPGMITDHNADEITGTQVTWNFGGEHVRDRDLELMVTSRVAWE